MDVLGRDAGRIRVCRRREPGCDITIQAHPGWEEQFATITPLPGEEPAATARRAAAMLTEEGATVLKQTVFGSAGARGAALAAMGDIEWPVTWIAADPCGRRALAGMQFHAVTGRRVQTLWSDDRPVGRTFTDDIARYAVLADIRPGDPSQPRGDQVYDSFCRIESALAEAQMSFHDVARTWLFVDRILDWYGDLNEARSRFLAERRVRERLVPASTGIGCANPYGVAMVTEAYAIQRHDGSRPAEPVRSPLQGPAPAYGSAFSRAVEAAVGRSRRLMVSGTASITADGQSAHRGDLSAQIDLTLKVVEAMLEARGMGFDGVSRAIAYFKEPISEAELAHYLTRTPLGQFPVIVVEADVCRDELLFEIELDAIA